MHAPVCGIFVPHWKTKRKVGVPLKTWKRTYIILLILCALILGAAIAIKFLCSGRDKGVFIQPKGTYPPAMVTAFYQKDGRWADDKLGDSPCTMGRSGCLTCCIASALSADGGSSDTKETVSAGQWNQIFGEAGVYNASGDIVWGRLSDALEEGKVLVASSVDPEEIEKLLSQGRYPIVKVKVGGNGAGHWVLLVGSRDGEYLCMDPLEPSGELAPLSRHGSVVYRMRCVYVNER